MTNDRITGPCPKCQEQRDQATELKEVLEQVLGCPDFCCPECSEEIRSVLEKYYGTDHR